MTTKGFKQYYHYRDNHVALIISAERCCNTCLRSLYESRRGYICPVLVCSANGCRKFVTRATRLCDLYVDGINSKKCGGDNDG